MNAIETLESLSANGLFTEAQARALVRALEGAEGNAATKADVDATADTLRAETRALESRLETKIEGVRREVAALRGDLETKIEGVRGDLLKWGVGLMLSTVGLVLAGLYFMLAHFKP